MSGGAESKVARDEHSLQEHVPEEIRNRRLESARDVGFPGDGRAVGRADFPALG